MIICPKCKERKHPQFYGYFDFLNDDAEGHKCIYKDCDGILEKIDFPAKDFSILWKVSKDINFLESMIKLREENIIEYQMKLSQFKSQLGQQESSRVQNDTRPKCPTCGSTNIEKISLTKKAVGGFMFGIFSSDVRKTMHCKKCGYKW